MTSAPIYPTSTQVKKLTYVQVPSTKALASFFNKKNWQHMVTESRFYLTRTAQMNRNSYTGFQVRCHARVLNHVAHAQYYTKVYTAPNSNNYLIGITALVVLS